MQNNIDNNPWGQRNPEPNAAYMANMQQMMGGQQINPANLTPVQLQQWQQWQMQYQAWQAQYGKEYEKSMKAMSQMGSMPPQSVQGAPPLPPESVRPPLPVAPVEAPKPPLPASEPPEELSESEKNFDIEFKQWEKQFEDWKIQNANHPDKAQYSEYEKKWESWREHLLGRREQMKLKRLAANKTAQDKVDSAKTVYTPFNNEPLQFKKQSHEIMSEMINEKVEPEKSNFNWSNVLGKADSEEKGFSFDTVQNRDNQSSNDAKTKENSFNLFPEEDKKQCQPVFTTPGKVSNKQRDRDQKSQDRKSPNMQFDEQRNFSPNMNMGGFGHNNFGPGFGPNNCGPGFGPNNCGPGFGPNNCGPGFGPNNCGPGFGPNNFGGGFGPMNFGPGFGNGFFPNNCGPGFGPNNVGMGNFNQGFNNFPGNFNNNGFNNFNEGTRNFNNGPNNFNDGPNDFNDGPNNFNDGPNNFNDGPRNFNDGPRDRDGSRNFNEGSRDFNDAPRNLNDNPRNCEDGPRNFNEGSRDFNGGQRNLNDGSKNLNDGPRFFNDGSRGFKDGPRDSNDGTRNVDRPGMFNDGPRNFNDGPIGFNERARDFFNNGSRNLNDNMRGYNEGPRNFKDIDKESLDGNNMPKHFDGFKGPNDNFDNRSSEGNFGKRDIPNPAKNDQGGKFSFGDRPSNNDDRPNEESFFRDQSNSDFDNRRPGNEQFPWNNRSNNFDNRSNDGRFNRDRFDDQNFSGPDMRSNPPSLMDLPFNSNKPQNFQNPNNDRFENEDEKPGLSGSLMKKGWEKYEKDDYYDDPFEEKDEPPQMDSDYHFPNESKIKKSLLGPGPGPRAFNQRQNDPSFRSDFDDVSRQNDRIQRNDFISNQHYPGDRRFNDDKSGDLRPSQNNAQNTNKPPFPPQGPDNASREQDETAAQDPNHLSGFVGNILAKLGVGGTEKVGPFPVPTTLHSKEPPFIDDKRFPPPGNPENEWKPQVFDYSNSIRRTECDFQFEIVKDYSHGDIQPQSFDYGHGGGSSLKKFDYGHGSEQATITTSYEHKANVFDYSHGSSHSPSLDRFPNKSRSRELSDTSRFRELSNPSLSDNRGLDREAVQVEEDSLKSSNLDIDSRDRGRDIDRNRDRRDRDFDRNRDDRPRDRDRDFDRHKDRDFDRYRDRDLDRNRGADFARSRDRDVRDVDRNRDRDADQARNRDWSPNRRRSRSPLQRSRSPRRTNRREDESKRSEVNKEEGKEKEIKTENLPVPINKADSSLHVISVEDLIHIPGRSSRPNKIVFIMRGIAGSGKSFVTRLIKEKEMELGGSAPRILSIDDYFMIDGEEDVKDAESGQIVKKKVLKYEYDGNMESPYQLALLKAFKKTVSDGFFTFIIVDAANKQTKDLDEMWSFAKQKGFQVYVCEMDNDIPACFKRNIHKRSEPELESQARDWESAPKHYLRLDVRSLLQSEAIDDVEMEDAVEEVKVEETEPTTKTDKDNEKEEDEPEISYFLKSKWDDFESSVQKLDRLDGLKKKKPAQTTMEAYLYTDDFAQEPEPTATPGKKRVRWADMEERRQQEKMRAIGFVVGQTDWKRMMDPSSGESALTRTKYI